MANKYGPRIIDDGLVFCMDAAGDNKSYPIDGLDVEYLVISGGGAGGGGGGGGGAGGWILGSTQTTIASGTYPIVIGAGGTGYSSNSPGTDGGISSVFGISPSGGGGGGAMYGDNARDGASGGGGNLQSAGGESVAGQGNNGGDGAQHTSSGWDVGGGGGGAGTVGMAAHVRGTNKAGSGGTGKYFGDKFSNSIGESGWLCGGGGGATQAGTQNGGLAGLGGGGYGGGNGSYGFRGPGQDGDANSGGGGGAGNEGGGVFGKSGNGGSGIVLIRYSGPPRAKGGDSIISHRGYTVHVFTSSGNFIVGETVSDLSTSKKYGTLTNMTNSNYIRGQGGYWTFDGTNESIIIPGGGALEISDTLTAMVWVYYISGNGRIFQKDASGGYTRCWEIGGYLGQFRIEMWHSDGTNVGAQTGGALTPNTWTHLAMTYDGSQIKMYKNTQLVRTINFAGDIRTDSNTPLILGGLWGTGEYLNGRIANAQLYNVALTQDQILHNYNIQKGRLGL